MRVDSDWAFGSPRRCASLPWQCVSLVRERPNGRTAHSTPAAAATVGAPDEQGEARGGGGCVTLLSSVSPVALHARSGCRCLLLLLVLCLGSYRVECVDDERHELCDICVERIGGARRRGGGGGRHSWGRGERERGGSGRCSESVARRQTGRKAKANGRSSRSQRLQGLSGKKTSTKILKLC